MEPPVISIICIALFFVLLAGGLPVAFSLLLLGVVGYGLIDGWGVMSRTVGLNIYMALHDYSFTVIPLFIFIGELVVHSGLGTNLLGTARKWLSRLPGGMVHAVVVANAFFAAMCGSGVAASAIFSKLAVPEMAKEGYNRNLSAGSVAGAGPLSAIIPPSAAMVMYCILTDASLGDMLLAGVIPGIIIVIIMMIVIALLCTFKPSLAPAPHSVSWKERFSSLPATLPVIIIIISILGSIYFGIATPTEAAALGVLATLIICLVQRKLTWKMLRKSLIETAVVSGIMTFIVVCGRLFGSMITVSGLPRLISETLTALPVAPIVIVIMFMLMYIVLGCFMDGTTMMVLTLPIVAPVVIALGFDLVWFGILIICLIEIGGITPPFGVNLYATKGGLSGTLVDDMSIIDITRGTVPFLACYIVALAVFIAFPAIVLLLPNLMQ